MVHRGHSPHCGQRGDHCGEEPSTHYNIGHVLLAPFVLENGKFVNLFQTRTNVHNGRHESTENNVFHTSLASNVNLTVGHERVKCSSNHCDQVGHEVSEGSLVGQGLPCHEMPSTRSQVGQEYSARTGNTNNCQVLLHFVVDTRRCGCTGQDEAQKASLSGPVRSNARRESMCRNRRRSTNEHASVEPRKRSFFNKDHSEN
mmetsp:Transcript_20976/g.45603  ORF Transcript_20976/g.45603 Transcript_20976/m.45603 type:complete len:201 (+) Transcript_20976:453-1055(+)